MDKWVKISGTISVSNISDDEYARLMNLLECEDFVDNYNISRDNGLILFPNGCVLKTQPPGRVRFFLGEIAKIAVPKENSVIYSFDSEGNHTKYVFKNDVWNEYAGVVYYPEDDSTPSYEELMILYNRLRK